MQGSLFDFNSAKKNQLTSNAKLKRSAPVETDDILLTEKKQALKQQIKKVQIEQFRQQQTNPEEVRAFSVCEEPANERKKFDRASLIAKFAQERNELTALAKNKDKADKIINDISLTDKFQDLLNQQMTFILPAHYKKLLETFENLDQILRCMQIQNKRLFVSDVVENYTQSYKRRLEQKQILQIKQVMDESFDLKWERNLDSKLCLVIQVERQRLSQQEARKEQFKKNLFALVEVEHRQFLEDNKLVHRDTKIWHPDFKVHDMQEIPEFQTPPKPDEPQPETLQNILKQKLIKNEILNQLIQKQAETEQETRQQKIQRCLEEAKKIKLEQAQNQVKLPDHLLKLIRAKEVIQQQEKERNQHIQMAPLNTEELKTFSRTIKAIVVSDGNINIHGVSNYYFAQLVEKLKGSLKSFSVNQIEKCVNELITKFPEFLQIKQLMSGKIVTVNLNEYTNTIHQLGEL